MNIRRFFLYICIYCLPIYLTNFPQINGRLVRPIKLILIPIILCHCAGLKLSSKTETFMNTHAKNYHNVPLSVNDWWWGKTGKCCYVVHDRSTILKKKIQISSEPCKLFAGRISFFEHIAIRQWCGFFHLLHHIHCVTGSIAMLMPVNCVVLSRSPREDSYILHVHYRQEIWNTCNVWN